MVPVSSSKEKTEGKKPEGRFLRPGVIPLFGSTNREEVLERIRTRRERRAEDEEISDDG